MTTKRKPQVPKIPKGWRKLPKGTLIKDGDKFDMSPFEWCATSCVGKKVGQPGASLSIYIRRIKPLNKDFKVKIEWSPLPNYPDLVILSFERPDFYSGALSLHSIVERRAVITALREFDRKKGKK